MSESVASGIGFGILIDKELGFSLNNKNSSEVFQQERRFSKNWNGFIKNITNLQSKKDLTN